MILDEPSPRSRCGSCRRTSCSCRLVRGPDRSRSAFGHVRNWSLLLAQADFWRRSIRFSQAAIRFQLTTFWSTNWVLTTPQGRAVPRLPIGCHLATTQEEQRLLSRRGLTVEE